MGTTVLAKYEIWVSFLGQIFNISVALYSALFNFYKSALSLSFCIFEMRNGSFITEGQLVMLLLL
jgi:hypothetical protein